jgi:hypothetical protein
MVSHVVHATGADPNSTPTAVSVPQLRELAMQLLGAMDRLIRYPKTKTTPEIHWIPQREVARQVCKKECPVRAGFVAGQGIFLSDSLNPIDDAFDRSILVHELVHHLQEQSHSYDHETPCRRWHAREMEAYAVQNAYLMHIGSNRHVGGGLSIAVCRQHDRELPNAIGDASIAE